MGRSIERIAVGTLVFSVSILSIVGLMAIWEMLSEDVLWKSFSTIGVLAVVALVIMGIARVASNYYQNQPKMPQPESVEWRAARNVLLAIVGAAFLFFAALSIMSIWDFIGDDSLWHAINSMILLCVSAVIMLVAFKSQMEV